MLAELMPDWISQDAVRRVSKWPLASDEDALMLVTCLRGLLQLDLPRNDPLFATVLRQWHPECPQAGTWCRRACAVECVSDGAYEDCPINCSGLHETMARDGLAQALVDDWLHRNALNWAELRWVAEDLPDDAATHERLRQLLPQLEEHELRTMQALQAEARECDGCQVRQPGWLFVDDERTCDDCLHDDDFRLRDRVPGAADLLMPKVSASHLREVIELLGELASTRPCSQRAPEGPLEVLGHALMTWPVRRHGGQRGTPAEKWWRKTAWVRQKVGGLLCFDCRAPVGIAHSPDCVMALCRNCHLPPWACPGCEAPLTRSRGESAEYFSASGRLS